MTFTFVHAADIHLGYRQYGSAERFNDFAAAFQHLADETIARQADALILAGDLFHKRTIDPLTLLQATVILQELRAAGVPVLAVQGNHERPHYQEVTSWLDYLAEMRLITLLSAQYAEGEIAVQPWSEERMGGTYVDLPQGVRVMGVQYYGAATARVVRDLADALPSLERDDGRPAYTILILHAGLQGILDHYSATLSRAQLEPLHPYVDYLALGHIHKPFAQDDWIYNPGSIETTSMAEVAWDDRGFYVVEAHPGATPPHRAAKARNLRRPFVRRRFSVATYDSPAELVQALESYLAREADGHASHRPLPRAGEAGAEDRRPVMELELYGVLAFSRSDLDILHIQQLVREAFGALIAMVKDATVPGGFDIQLDDTLTRAELERYVLRELAEQDIRYQHQGEVWSDLALRLKQLALSGSAPEEIVRELEAFDADLADLSGPEGAPHSSGGESRED